MFKRLALWLGKVIARAAFEVAREKVSTHLAEATQLEQKAQEMVAKAVVLRKTAESVDPQKLFNILLDAELAERERRA